MSGRFSTTSYRIDDKYSFPAPIHTILTHRALKYPIATLLGLLTLLIFVGCPPDVFDLPETLANPVRQGVIYGAAFVFKNAVTVALLGAVAAYFCAVCYVCTHAESLRTGGWKVQPSLGSPVLAYWSHRTTTALIFASGAHLALVYWRNDLYSVISLTVVVMGLMVLGFFKGVMIMQP
jgi:hypothetical protein